MKTRVAMDITLAVTLLACFVFFAAPASAAARIDSITPTAAERGAEVESARGRLWREERERLGRWGVCPGALRHR